MRIVDLRSDTVTRPTPEMIAAMTTSAVGDDVLGDDPTVIELETLACQMTGKAAAVFVPSGTMGNQIAIAAHTQPGNAIIVEEEAHIVYYEVGAPAVLSNVLTWTLPSVNGVMSPDVIDARVTKANLHTPGTTLICIENTHNRAGGAVTSLSTMAGYRRVADKHGIALHMDGARAFNAAVALGVSIGDLLASVDSASLCLSKGLRSPVGSILVGSESLIDRARIWRKRLGGGMRQAGILAACGLVSLRTCIDRLAEDHAHCQRLAEAIGALPGLSTSPGSNPTNLCLIDTETEAAEWASRLHAAGVWCFPVASHRLRLVTHADVSAEDVEHAIGVFESLARG